MSKIKGDASARLEKVRRRFDQWRRTHRARSRLPESLWAAAVELGREYGINRTTRALRLDYYSLKKRIERALSSRGETDASKRSDAHALKRGDTHRSTQGKTVRPGVLRRKAARRGRKAAEPGSPEGSASATFLEVGSLLSAPAGECLVEVEDVEGAKMRVHLKGVETIERAIPELALLARRFWGVRG